VTTGSSNSSKDIGQIYSGGWFFFSLDSSVSYSTSRPFVRRARRFNQSAIDRTGAEAGTVIAAYFLSSSIRTGIIIDVVRLNTALVEPFVIGARVSVVVEVIVVGVLVVTRILDVIVVVFVVVGLFVVVVEFGLVPARANPSLSIATRSFHGVENNNDIKSTLLCRSGEGFSRRRRAGGGGTLYGR